MKDGTKWEYPESNEERFNRWASFYNRGIISKMMKFRDFRSFKEIYTSSSLAKSIKKKYNKTHEERYTIDMFFKLIKSLVKIEIIDENFNLIERKSSYTDVTKISIRVIAPCNLQNVRQIKGNTQINAPRTFVNFNIKTPAELRERFVAETKKAGSDASKEVRRFMKSFCDNKGLVK